MLSDQLKREQAKRSQKLLSLLGRCPIIFDGAIGAELQKRGMKAGELPEVYNITHADWVVDIQLAYLRSGAKCLSTNTFATNSLHLEGSGYTLDRVIKAACENAKRARDIYLKENDKEDIYIFLDIGPIGELLEPSGTMTFDRAYALFEELVVLARDDVDGILIETISDLYEMKAAVLAAQENSGLCLFALHTFADGHRTLLGADVKTTVTLLEGLCVDALGINCSMGPDEMAPLVNEFLRFSSTPVFVMANAGLPVYDREQPIYKMAPETYAAQAIEFVRQGVSVIGGCCGTSPEHIGLIREGIKSIDFKRPDVSFQTNVCGPSKTVTIGKRTIICGERINPTGKKAMQQALLAGDLDMIWSEAMAQKEAGADVLDVNVGVPGLDEMQVMEKAIKGIQAIIDLPLQIDSASCEVIETACRAYNGKPIINSVNGKKDVMERIFPIAKKYGAVVIGLTLDDNGIPKNAHERLKIAELIVSTAKTYGIEKHNLLIDCLVLTASAQQSDVMETLRAVYLVREKLGVHTVLGCSNVSFGLPNRPLLNKTFLAMALQAQLSCPIINPLDKDLLATVAAYDALSAKDPDSSRYIQRYADAMSGEKKKASAVASFDKLSLYDSVLCGRKDHVIKATHHALLSRDAMTIINEQLIAALNEVGRQYEDKKIYLPQLILAAESAKMAFTVLQEKIDHKTAMKKGPILLATVEGDIHDIGKNIVKVVLESYGYHIIDLGRDVKSDVIYEAFLQHRPKLIGLSALMTTTVVKMEECIARLKAESSMCPIIVGGAVLTESTARQIGADAYAKDALAAVALAARMIDQKT